MCFLAADGGLDAECWHSQRRCLDVSVQFVLPRRLGGEAGEEAAQQEAAGKTEGWRQDIFIPSIFPWSSANRKCKQLLPQATTSGQLYLLSGSLLQPRTWPEPVLHLAKAFFSLDKLSNLNINLAVMTVGFWNCPGRIYQLLGTPQHKTTWKAEKFSVPK